MSPCVVVVDNGSFMAGFWDVNYFWELSPHAWLPLGCMMQVRGLVQQEMLGALSQYDALLTPTAPTPAYKLGEKASDPLAMYKGDLMTININLAGLPAIVVPSGSTQEDGATLPVGIQLIGRMMGEAELCGLAHVFERTLSLS